MFPLPIVQSAELTFRDDVREIMSGRVQGIPPPLAQAPTTPVRSPQVDRRPTPRSNGYGYMDAQQSRPSNTSAFRKPQPPPPNQRPIPRRPSPRRPATRSRTHDSSADPVDASPVRAEAEQLMPPRFNQGKNGIMLYYANANSTFLSTPPPGNEHE